MSLKKTLHCETWNSIPRQCKECTRAIYTEENKNIFYQCNIFGTFKRDCSSCLKRLKPLPAPKDIKDK